MKKNILLATLVTILFSSVSFAQTTPSVSKKETKMEKKEDNTTQKMAKHEAKKEEKESKKEIRLAHKKANK